MRQTRLRCDCSIFWCFLVEDTSLSLLHHHLWANMALWQPAVPRSPSPLTHIHHLHHHHLTSGQRPPPPPVSPKALKTSMSAAIWLQFDSYCWMKTCLGPLTLILLLYNKCVSQWNIHIRWTGDFKLSVYVIVSVRACSSLCDWQVTCPGKPHPHPMSAGISCSLYETAQMEGQPMDGWLITERKPNRK